MKLQSTIVYKGKRNIGQIQQQHKFLFAKVAHFQEHQKALKIR